MHHGNTLVHKSTIFLIPFSMTNKGFLELVGYWFVVLVYLKERDSFRVELKSAFCP